MNKYKYTRDEIKEAKKQNSWDNKISYYKDDIPELFMIFMRLYKISFEDSIKKKKAVALIEMFIKKEEYKDIAKLALLRISQPKQNLKTPQKHKAWIIPNINMQLEFVENGEFQMGTNFPWNDAEKKHSVILTDDFWIGKFEVTQAEYYQIMNENPSFYKNNENPVEMVSFFDAMKFCEKLTKKDQLANVLPKGYEYRLPTEAEWEFAAKGGNKSENYRFSGSNECWEVAFYSNSLSKEEEHTYNVGLKLPNELGLYDMNGNVAELTYDQCDYKKRKGCITNTYRNGVINPLSRIGEYRIRKGGYFSSGIKSNAGKYIVKPNGKTQNIGFRICLAPKLLSQVEVNKCK